MEENNRICFVWVFYLIQKNSLGMCARVLLLETFVGFKMADILRCVTIFSTVQYEKNIKAAIYL